MSDLKSTMDRMEQQTGTRTPFDDPESLERDHREIAHELAAILNRFMDEINALIVKFESKTNA